MKGWKFYMLALLLGSQVAIAGETLQDITVLALSAPDGRAVVRLPDDKMQVLKPGDAVDGTQAKVLQVLADKLVLEETVADEKSGEKRRETVWLYKAVDGKSRIERLLRVLPKGEQPVHEAAKAVKGRH
ncbi:MAG TPA: hypothetical protein VFX02_12230 [Gammaproteobacteria bacterium]|nr:hypothetical protein [Gammaproteobacteria bacterium]